MSFGLASINPSQYFAADLACSSMIEFLKDDTNNTKNEAVAVVKLFFSKVKPHS
jgi:hypothetical protein